MPVELGPLTTDGGIAPVQPRVLQREAQLGVLAPILQHLQPPRRTRCVPRRQPLQRLHRHLLHIASVECLATRSPCGVRFVDVLCTMLRQVMQQLGRCDSHAPQIHGTDTAGEGQQ